MQQIILRLKNIFYTHLLLLILWVCYYEQNALQILKMILKLTNGLVTKLGTSFLSCVQVGLNPREL